MDNKVVDYRQKVQGSIPQFVEYLQYSGWNQYQPFLDVEWKVNPQLRPSRLDQVRHRQDQPSIPTSTRSPRLPFHDAKTFNKTLYFLTANYKVKDNLSVYAQFATGFLMPDIQHHQVGHPKLGPAAPQGSTNYQSTVSRRQVHLRRRRLSINFTNKLQPPRWTETVSFNLGGARYKGVEAAATYALTRGPVRLRQRLDQPGRRPGGDHRRPGRPFVVVGGNRSARPPRAPPARA